MRKGSVNRRGLILGAAAAGVAAAGGGYVYLREADMGAYEDAATALRAPLSPAAGLSELVRFATLAANSHNTQPWLFDIAGDRITILPDFTRKTAVVDPDDHHLFCTLGCATENLVVAAGALGLQATPVFVAEGAGSIAIALAKTAPLQSAWLAAIPARQMTRNVYDGRAVPAADLAAIERAAASESVDVMIITDRARIEAILGLIVEGNTVQFDDPAFIAELKGWIRFDAAEALRTGDGLFTGTTGNPSVPPWLGRLIFSFAASAKSEAERYAAQIRSSAGIAVFVGKAADRAHWVEAGRSYQRFALEATVRGLKHAFVNQAVEVPSVRAKLAAELGIPGRRPDLVLRFGTGSPMPRSLRRPASAVIVGGKA